LLGVIALVQRNTAMHQARISLSEALAGESAAAMGSDVEVGDLLALAADERVPTEQARSALVGAVEQPLEAVLDGRTGEVNGLAYDPKRPILAVGTVHGVVLWDTATDRAIGRPLDAGQQVNSVAFNADGSLLAVAGQNGYATVYRSPNWSLDQSLPAGRSSVDAVAFSSINGDLAYVTGSGEIFSWDLADHHHWDAASGPGVGLLSVAFDARAPLLAVGGAKEFSDGKVVGLVKIYDQTGTVASSYRDGTGAVYKVAFSPNGSLVAATDGSGVVLLDSASGQKNGRVPVTSSVEAVAFNPSGTLMATGDDQGAVQLWATSSLQQTGPTMEDGSIVYGLAFSPSGRSLASAGFDGKVMVWSAAGRTPLSSSVAVRGGVQDLSISSASNLLATANSDGSVSVFSLRTGRRVRHLAFDTEGTRPGTTVPNPLTAVAFSPSGSTLAIGTSTGDVVLFDPGSGSYSQLALPVYDERKVEAVPRAVNMIAFGGPGTVATGNANGDVYVWDVRKRKLEESIPVGNENNGITALGFSPGGRSLAIATAFGGLEIFDIGSSHPTGTQVKVNEAIWSLAFGSGGSLLAAGDNAGNVELFEAAGKSYQPAGTLPGDGNPVFGLAVAPGGSELATVDSGSELRLWDLGDDQELGAPLLTGSAVFALTFAPDGGVLATGGPNGAVLLWPSLLWSSSLKAFSASLCSRLRENLSSIQWHQYVPGQPFQATCAAY
ncbi:MAG TPA: hypothetical protein VMF65_20770, partial [Acidimicrobiales bacterium]|nr:hypothetical protein [Acidimicrobiales bacterium]